MTISAWFMLATLLAYFLILLLISQRSSAQGAKGNNAFSAQDVSRHGGWWHSA